ncbi:MAG: hypothetical protein V1831_01285 [Candidatus Woesearchaeota archaeon]
MDSIHIVQLSQKEPLFEVGYVRQDFLYRPNNLSFNGRYFVLDDPSAVEEYADKHCMDIVDYGDSYPELVNQFLNEGVDTYIRLLRNMTPAASKNYRRKQVVRDALINGSDDSKVDVLDGLIDQMMVAFNSNKSDEIRNIISLIGRIGNNLPQEYRIDEIESVAKYGLKLLASPDGSERKGLSKIISAYREFYSAMHNRDYSKDYSGIVNADKKIAKLSKETNIEGLITLHKDLYNAIRAGNRLKADTIEALISLNIDFPSLRIGAQ